MLIRQGGWFGPDKEWFSLGGESIPETRDLLYSPVRPSGTFSEPSYLGLVSISFMVISGFSKNPHKHSGFIFFINFFTIILCQSRSALIYAGFLLIIYIYRNKNKNNFYSKGLVFPFILLIGIGSISFILETISSVQGSISIQNRIYAPLGSVLTFLVSNPLGIPFYDRLNQFQDINRGVTWDMVSHNSIFNFFFSYGFVGILIIFQIIILAKGDKVLMLILFASLMQNGSFLNFDKFFLIFVVFKIYTYTISNNLTLRREN
jgi:hypothetical protein